MANTIILAGEFTRGEAIAGGAITPGMVVGFFAAADVLMPHPTAAGDAAPRFALEGGGDHTGGIDDAYPSGESCLYGHAHRGAVVWALLEAGANVAKGAYLESNGAGYLQALTGDHALCEAGEDKDNSGGGSAVRIRAVVL